MVSPGCKGHNLSLLATSGWSANDALRGASWTFSSRLRHRQVSR